MKTWMATVVVIITAGCWAPASESLRLLPREEPLRVFGGGPRAIQVSFQVDSDNRVQMPVALRLLQTSTATTMRIADLDWKILEALPGQTLLDSAEVELPNVRARTRFILQWLGATNRVIGSAEMLVYPTNLLAELEAISGSTGDTELLGIFDPANELKPVLREQGVRFLDLEDSGVTKFRGRLAILGPFHSPSNVPKDLANQILALAKDGAAAVWIIPDSDSEEISPGYYSVPVGDTTVVVLQESFVPHLRQRPASQLALLHCCRLAMNPEPPRLPDLDP